jgi:hypothetical protein
MMTEELGPRTEDYYDQHQKTRPVVDPAEAKEPIPAQVSFGARLKAILKRVKKQPKA